MDKNKKQGILFIIGAGFCFALMTFFVRMAGDLPTIQKAFFRNVVAVFVAFVLLLRSKQGFRIQKGSIPGLLARSFFGTCGILCNFYAADHLHIADASMLNKLSPFSAVLCAWLFLGERVRARQGLAIAGAFAGAMLVVKPGFAFSAGSTGAALAGLAGGIAAGGAYACIRRLGQLGTDPSFIVLFFSAFSTLASAPFMVFDFSPMTPAQVAILFGAGAAATVGQFGITAAYRLASPRELAVYDYSNVVFAATFGFLVFGQVPDILSWLGMAVIVCMGALMTQRHASSS